MDKSEKAKAGPRLIALMLSRYGGRVPRQDMGELTVEAGYDRPQDWSGYLNGKTGLRDENGAITLQPAAWRWLAFEYLRPLSSDSEAAAVTQFERGSAAPWEG